MISTPPFKQVTSRAQTLPRTSYKGWHPGAGLISPASLAEWLLAKLLSLPSCERRNMVILLPRAHIWPSRACPSGSSDSALPLQQAISSLRRPPPVAAHSLFQTSRCASFPSVPSSPLLLLTLLLGAWSPLCDPAFGITSQRWHKCHLASSTWELTRLFTGREIPAQFAGLLLCVHN